MRALAKLREYGCTVELLDGDVLINPPPPAKWIPRLIECKPDIVKALKAEQLSVNNKLLSLGEESKIRAWMHHLGETNELLINEYLEKCQIDPDAKQYFLKRSEEVHDVVSSAEKVMCRYCQHFKADNIGDGSGIGDCIINAPASKKGLMWLNSDRYCEQYKYNLAYC